MYTIEKLRLNKTVSVFIPKNSDLFARVGPRDIPCNASGEDSDVIPMNQRTLDSLEYMDKYDAFMQSVEQRNRESGGTAAQSTGKENDHEDSED